MLSKKEYTPIKLREHCIKTMQFSNRNSNAYKEHELILAILDENISMRYKLDHLESREQKLIEKLEEINTRNAELYNSPKQKEVDFSEWNLAQELLEIYKKE